jgi:hypothetical protein
MGPCNYSAITLVICDGFDLANEVLAAHWPLAVKFGDQTYKVVREGWKRGHNECERA